MLLLAWVHAAHAHAWIGLNALVGPAGPIDPTAPTNGTGDELGWLGSAPWAKVALIVTAAIFVLSLGGTLAKRGAKRGSAFGRRDFSLEVARLESLAATPISDASDGPVHLVGVLASASETLGGEPGRERVYFNQSGAGRRTAVASELVLLRDESGQASIENLEAARVITAKDPRPKGRPNDRATISLRLGTRVQVLGYFRADIHGRDEAAAERVYGVVGDNQQLQIRVLPPVDDDKAADGDAPADHHEDPPSPKDDFLDADSPPDP